MTVGSYQDLLERLATVSAQLAVEPATTAWHNHLWHQQRKLIAQLREFPDQVACAVAFDIGGLDSGGGN